VTDTPLRGTGSRRRLVPVFPAVIALGAVAVAALILTILQLGGAEPAPPSPALRRLPLFHATLNGTSGLLLILGYLCIRRRLIAAHVACVGSAVLTTAVFLGSYLYYHAQVGSVPYGGTGWLRPLYFTILISHASLAAVVVPLVIAVITFTARRRFDEHRWLARWTLPLWLWVSASGVLIYLMLYVW
jgi:putative membrane protein